MKVIRVSDYTELSRKAADLIAAEIREKPDCVLGLATGSTPEGTYKQLVADYEAGKLDFSRVRTVNLDEYRGLPGSHPQSYRYFMDTHLFSHININKKNTFIPDGLAPEKEECEEYEKRILSLGGIDLQLLGLGRNGHIGFNEPGASFIMETHPVKLTSSTIQANARLFNDPEEVPGRAVTMGIGTIMSAGKILLIVNGEDKAEALRKALYGPVTPSCPASILQDHPALTVIADEEAFREIQACGS